MKKISNKNMRNHHAVNKATEALQSLDGIEKAAAPFFLFTRIQAAIEHGNPQENFWVKAGAFISRPAIAWLCVIFLIFINALTIKNFTNNIEKNNATVRNNTAAKYDMAINVVSIYDAETPEP